MAYDNLPNQNSGFLTSLSKAINFVNPTGKFDLGVSEWLANKGAQNDYNNVYVGPGGNAPQPNQEQLDSAAKVSALEKGVNTWNQPKKTVTTTGVIDKAAVNNDTGQNVQQESNEARVLREYNERMTGSINSGYDNYFTQLDTMLNSTLPGQRTSQEGIINNNWNKNVNNLDNQLQQGVTSLGNERTGAIGNQDKNLKSMAENLRNLFQSGNIYLGSKGAADSSAANQYSYALTKQGNKARGDIMNNTSGILAEINQRETGIKQTYETEKKNLELDKQTKMGELSNWFNEQQNSLYTAKMQGGLNKSKDLQALSTSILDAAMTRMNQIETDSKNKAGILEKWALDNSTTVAQAKEKMAGLASYNPTLPNYNGIFGQPQVSNGNYSLPLAGYGSGSTEEKKKSIFG